MSHRYIIRTYEDCDKKGATSPGTIVEPLNRELSFYAYSADEIEDRLRREVAAGLLAPGRAASLYGEFRRIRLPRPAPSEQQQSPSFTPDAVAQ